MMLGMFVSVSLCMFTVLNAMLMSKGTATVCCGGIRLLKLFVIWWEMLCKAVCVECLCLNPCFCFVYVSDHCLSFEVNASVLLCRWFFVG